MTKEEIIKWLPKHGWIYLRNEEYYRTYKKQHSHHDETIYIWDDAGVSYEKDAYVAVTVRFEDVLCVEDNVYFNVSGIVPDD